MPDLIDQAYALVKGVVAANTIGPVINGVVGVAALAGGVGTAGLGLLATLGTLNGGGESAGGARRTTGGFGRYRDATAATTPAAAAVAAVDLRARPVPPVLVGTQSSSSPDSSRDRSTAS
jgi:hypothetical protein